MSGFFLVLVSMHWIISVVDMIIITHIATILYVRFTWKKLQQFSTAQVIDEKTLKELIKEFVTTLHSGLQKYPSSEFLLEAESKLSFFVK
ncbi:hypothetical protein CQA07_26905 [Klebsiella pneumoniae]|nr:hypothetical protein CQA07_26905 [Klebsiella pneumoniae]